MTHEIELATVIVAEAPPAEKSAKRLSTFAIWLSIIALLVCGFLFLVFRVVPGPGFVVLLVLGGGAGVAGLVLSIRFRIARRRGASARWALALAALAFVVDLVLIAIIPVGLAQTRFGLANVELRAQGPDGITVSYSDDVEAHIDEIWPAVGWAKFNTKESSTEITVNAPIGSVDAAVSCQILWDGEIVVDESSANGTVTCRYDVH